MDWNSYRNRRKANIHIKIDMDISVAVDDKPWTKEELDISKSGPIALARAVVQQWKNDGMPNDPGILPWIKILEQFKED